MKHKKNIKIKILSNAQQQKNKQIDKLLFRIKYYQGIVQDTSISIQEYRSLGVFERKDFNIQINKLEECFKTLVNLRMFLETSKKNIDTNDILTKLQTINNDLSSIFKNNGTSNIEDLLNICLGDSYLINNITPNIKNVFKLIKKYSKPIGYKIINWKKDNSKGSNDKTNIKERLPRNKIVEDFMIAETAKICDCFDLCRTSKIFYTKVYGMKIAFPNKKTKQTLIVSVIVDDIVMSCFNEPFINKKINDLKINKLDEEDFKTDDFNMFISLLTLKELLVYSNKELYQKYIGYITNTKLIKQRTITQVVNEFIGDVLYIQRKTLIQLLMKRNNPEFQYLAYLLYELLPSDDNGKLDTKEQCKLYDSLPWPIKQNFEEAMDSTRKYTLKISNYDTNNIPLEQQICLMKVSDKVKEKAMVKLKEIKSKSEDSGSKARQYLDGLLKIPFNIYKKEELLGYLKQLNIKFKVLLENIDDKQLIKDSYNVIEIYKYIDYLKSDYIKKIKKKHIEDIIKHLTTGKGKNFIENICLINTILKKIKIKHKKICHSGKKNKYMKTEIKNIILKLENNKSFINELIKHIPKKIIFKHKINIEKEIINIENDLTNITNSFKSVKESLDNAIYGHTKAKRQIERIIGQWISGEQKGYCFGFEGPPGTGKTSMARKGLSNCLKDKDGNNRPFAFIALGGSSNGSTISGHNYTYVGSTWGKIVDILMESKCMNPIIFIDELDKVSRTEHGREIIGILTHLIDQTQNESFQDKYFSGIDIDLSKVLFVFSYNDASKIDKILLDRIHRIKFDVLTTYDKIEIANNFLIPQLYNKMGITEDILKINNNVIKYIIENYTNESGVRKLKKILFEIVSEINLNLLTYDVSNIPIILTKDDVKLKYLKDIYEIKCTKIHSTPNVGVINGLWANSLGNGGIISIEANIFPCNNLLELKLTGSQGDVMKESMNVAKTLAWKLTKPKQQTSFLNKIKKSKQQGIHIHCPEGATPKDGPSAGTAITITLYSLFNNKRIKNDLAITGEINLQGKVMEIGGLELKILGGINAGVKTFIFPKQNNHDFIKIKDKYTNIIKDIIFIQVDNINDVLEHVFI